MAAPAGRLSDARYINWVKDTLALIYLKEGLEVFVDNQSAVFHSHLITTLGSRACGTCSCRDLIKRKGQWTINCPVCHPWLTEIISKHKYRPQPVLAPGNTDPKLWTTDAWEVMKLFQVKGYQDQHSARDTDVAGILALIANCDHFHSFINNMNLVDQIREIRNRITHSSDLHVETVDLGRDLQTMLQFLRGLMSLSVAEQDAVYFAIEKIQELQTGLLDVSLNKELELQALKQNQNALAVELICLKQELAATSEKARTTGSAVNTIQADLGASSAYRVKLETDLTEKVTSVGEHLKKLQAVQDCFNRFLQVNDLEQDKARLSTALEHHDQRIKNLEIQAHKKTKPWMFDMLPRPMDEILVMPLKRKQGNKESDSTDVIKAKRKQESRSPKQGSSGLQSGADGDLRDDLQNMCITPERGLSGIQHDQCVTKPEFQALERVVHEMAYPKCSHVTDRPSGSSGFAGQDVTMRTTTDTDAAQGQDPENQSIVRSQRPEEVTPFASTSNCVTLHLDELESSTFDGRLIRIDSERMDELMQSAKQFAEGAFGTVHTCTVMANKETQDMAIKKICYSGKKVNRCSAIKEMLVSRLKHHYIVPLLAYSQHNDRETFYFLMPYMDHGNLHKHIMDDTERIKERKEPTLTKAIRSKILFQLAAVLEFLHEPVDKFRGSYVHGDISSKNIVLDGQYNMRLLDFGLSKEVKGHIPGTTSTSSNICGTEGYVPENSEVVPKRDVYSWAASKFTKRQECYFHIQKCIKGMTNSFGHDQTPRIFLLQMLSFKGIKRFFELCIESIWGTTDDQTVKCILELVDGCKQFKISAKEIVAKLKVQMIEASFKAYDKFPKNSMCMICMIGKKVKGNILDHECGVDVCVSCLRNSYLNPIKCPCCHEDLFSPIGVRWGAVLIAGNDVDDKKLATIFKNDVEKMYRAITSRRQLAIGIREERVKRVCLRNPGTEEKLKPELGVAFNDLLSEDINTLLLYFTGHTDNNREFILGSKKETISERELSKMLQELLSLIIEKPKPKLIILLDYCYPVQTLDYTVLNEIQKLKLTVLKITSCGPHEPANVNVDEGSVFTNLLVQCLSGRAGEIKCLTSPNDHTECCHCTDIDLSNKCGDGFVSVDYILDYTGRHMPNQEPKLTSKDANWISTKIGYYRSKIPAFKIEFDSVQFSCDYLPETEDELMEMLQKFLEENCGVDELRCKHFKDVYGVFVKTGADDGQQHELKTLAMIEGAWNGLSVLSVLQRNIKNIDNGKVGFFLEKEEIKPESIVRIVLKNRNKVTIEKVETVSIPLTELKAMQDCSWLTQPDAQIDDLSDCHEFLKDKVLDFMVDVYILKKQKQAQSTASEGQCRASQKCADHQNRLVESFCETDNTWICVDCFRNRKGKHQGHEIIDLEEKMNADQQLSKEQTGKLVFTFPLDENGEYEKFFSVHIEDDNLAENGNNELAGQTGQSEVDDSEMQGASNFMT